MNFLEEHGGKFVGVLATFIATGILWMVRTVFTNQKQLELLEQKQDMQHDAAIKGLTAVSEDISEIKNNNSSAVEAQETMLRIMREIREQK